jgi:DNA-binding LacI/PurR family transcriptional regulator/GAF domain-containing protein
MNRKRKTEERAGTRNVRPTIGFLGEHLVDEYNTSIWEGVRDAAWEHEATLLYFSGGILRDPRGFNAQANILYGLVDEETLDGLVLWGAQLAHYTTLEELTAFCEQYRPLPIVNIGLALEGIPSLLVDSYQGMHDVVAHLIEVHGHRRIAYICGPGDTSESRDRYRGYTDALAEHGLSLDPALVVTGDELMDKAWRKNLNSGPVSVRILLDERGLRLRTDFEALVMHDDGSCRYALDVLQERGVRVPADVALAGFDDVSYSRYLTPPLTTARQSFYDLGRRGAEMLLARLRGEEVPEQVVLPVKVIVRQSCGCADPAVVAAGPEGDRPGRMAGQKSLKAALAGEREKIIAEIVSEMGDSEETSRRAEQALDGFIAEVEGESPGIFLQTLDELLRQVTAAGDGSQTGAEQDVAAWQEALSTLRRHLLPYLDGDALRRAENLWQQARVLIGETARRAQAYQALRAGQRAQTLREIGGALITTFDVGELMDLVAEGLPSLGIPSAYLSLYEDPQPYTYPQPAPEWSRLMLAYDESGRVELEADGQRFGSRQLVPEGLWLRERQYSFVIVLLCFRENQLGFALFEAGPRDGTIYEALRRQISSALQGALLVRQAENRALQLQTAAEVSRAASSILDPNELIPEVVNLMRERFDLYYAGLFLVDQTGEWTGEADKWAVLRAGTGEAGRKMLEGGHKLEIGGASMIGWCVANRQARIALDVGEEAVRFDNPLLPETRSEMALPLISRGAAIGALTIQSKREAAFSQEDITVLQTMASQVANTIENAHLFEQAQSRAAELAVLNELGQALAARLNIGEVLDEVQRGASRLMDATNFYVALYDPDKDEITFPLDVTPEEGDRFRTLSTDEGLTGYIIRNRTGVLIQENLPERLAEMGVKMVGQPALSWLGVPMMVGDRVLGVLGVQSYTSPRAYDAHDRDLLTALASQTAIAIQNARLFERTQAALQESEAVHKRYLQQAWAEYQQTARHAGYETGQPDSTPLGDAVLPEVRRVMEQHRTIVSAGDGGGGEEHSALVVPVAIRGTIIGALGIHAADEARLWTEDEIALVETIAGRMALAAENLRLLDETQRRATQEQLLSQISDRMQRSANLEALMHMAAEELNKALGGSRVYVRMGTVAELTRKDEE